MAEPDYPGDHNRALFRRVRRRDRKPHDRHGRDQLRFVHRAGADASFRVHAVDLQRQLRYLFSEVYRDNLRAPLSTNLQPGDGPGLRRCGGHQERCAGFGDAGYRDSVRGCSCRASAVDAGLPASDHHRLLPARIRDRYLGAEFRTVADHPDADRDAPHLPRRRLLFDQRARRAVAHRHLVQSRGLSGQRLPMDLLRRVGRAGVVQRGGDAHHHHRLPAGDRMGL